MEDEPDMLASAGTDSPPAADERSANALPYCFILDDTYRVVMAGPSCGEDPLAPLYAADSVIDGLPDCIDRVVRALTSSWRTARPSGNITAIVSNYQVTIAPLHGSDGRRIAVFVRRHGPLYV
jgi:hypothetical protein